MNKKPNIRPFHLWIVTIVALFFFSIGAYDFVNIASKNISYLTSMYSTSGVEYFMNYPVPLLVLFGINIICGILGIIIALFNRRLAKKLVLISGISNSILTFITVTFMNRIQIIGLDMTITDITVIIATFGLFLYYKWVDRFVN